MKTYTSFVFLMAALIMFSGCATIFTGTRDLIHFNSEPRGAMVFINGVERCVTPCAVRVGRSVNETDVMIRLEGYESRMFVLDQDFNVVSILNLGNLLGWGIDVISGAVMRYGLRHYEVNLTREQHSALLNPMEIHINTESKQVDFHVMSHQ